MSEWKKVRLGDVCSTNISSITKIYPYEEILYLDTGSITCNKIETLQSYQLKEAPSRAKRLVKQGDIIYSAVRPNQLHYGYIDNPQSNLVVSTGFVVVSSNEEKVNSRFLYYYLIQSHITEHLHSIAEASTSTYPSLKPSDIESLEFSLPPLEEQKRIAGILGCLDDKIELNGRVNRNLEAQAEALFKRWFVDFEFPDENGAPYRESGGEMVESELGMIPKGWRVGVLGEVADIIMGQSPAGTSYNEEGKGEVFYQGRAEFGWRFPTRRLYTTEPKRMAERNSILMSVRAPVGDINIAYERCCIGRGLASIKSKDGNNSYLLYLMHALQCKLDRFNGEGTVFGSINKDSLSAMKIVVPENEIIVKYDEIVSGFDLRIMSLFAESCNLELLRDVLLPKLMNNEIKV